MRKILLLLFSYPTIFATAQTETTIRSHYTAVNSKIKESIEQGFEGPLYQNQVVINKNGKSWPAVGRYSDTTDYWYDDDPNHLSAADRNPKNVLLKVNTVRITLHLKTAEEYLYKDGKLLFYYSRQTEEGNEWETRMYFNTKGILFKSSVKANGKELTPKDFTTTEFKEFKPDAASIISYGKEYQELFFKTM
jgi:hypothetical protein